MINLRTSQILKRPVYGILNSRDLHERIKDQPKVKQIMTEFIYFIQKGSRDTFNDAKQLLKYRNSNNKTALVLSEMRRMKLDLIRLIPFSIFIILPGSALILPPYLYLFPNALPTTFMFDTQIEQREQERDLRQREAQKQLYMKFSKELQMLQNPTADSIITHSDLIEQRLNIANFTSYELVQVCDFLQIQYYSGTETILKISEFILNLPIHLKNLKNFIFQRQERKLIISYRDSWNRKLPFLIDFTKSKVLLYQIEQHYFNIQEEDQAFLRNDSINLDLSHFFKQRGLFGKLQYKEFHTQWLNVMQNKRMTVNLKIWYSVLHYQKYRPMMKFTSGSIK